MKKLRLLISALILALASATPSLAASGREDSSSFLVWAFLSVCGLIVIVQLLPVIFMAFGIVSGAVKSKEQKAIKAVNK